MEKTVLVTRPLPAATRTADRLRVQGYVPLLLPLTEIVPLNPTVPEGTFNAFVATSANALVHAKGNDAAWNSARVASSATVS